MVDANSAVDRRPRSYCSEFIFIGLAASRCDTMVMNADLGSLVWHGADDRCGLLPPACDLVPVLRSVWITGQIWAKRVNVSRYDESPSPFSTGLCLVVMRGDCASVLGNFFFVTRPLVGGLLALSACNLRLQLGRWRTFSIVTFIEAAEHLGPLTLNQIYERLQEFVDRHGDVKDGKPCGHPLR